MLLESWWKKSGRSASSRAAKSALFRHYATLVRREDRQPNYGSRYLKVSLTVFVCVCVRVATIGHWLTRAVALPTGYLGDRVGVAAAGAAGSGGAGALGCSDAWICRRAPIAIGLSALLRLLLFPCICHTSRCAQLPYSACFVCLSVALHRLYVNAYSQF